MLAAVHGQLWNASQIGSSLGVNYQTVNSYLDYLEGAFLVRRLPPYLTNLKKRLVKRPKLYWRDSGILHALLQTTTREQLFERPWISQSWEGFVIEQVLAFLAAQGEPHAAYFFRTSDGYEADLVIEREGELWAIEIKLSSAPRPEHLAQIDKVGEMIGATRRVLVSRATEVVDDGVRLSCSLEHLLEKFRATNGRP